MKTAKFLTCVTLAAVCLLATACNAQTPQATNQPMQSISPSISAVATKTPIATASPTYLVQTAQSTANEQTYIGTFKITKLLAQSSGGSTYDSATINKLIGREIVFTAEKATCFGDDISYLSKTALKPKYERVTLSDDELYTDYRVTFKSLGITTKTVIKITVTGQDGNICTFLIKSRNTLILIGGGAFFEVTRK